MVRTADAPPNRNAGNSAGATNAMGTGATSEPTPVAPAPAAPSTAGVVDGPAAPGSMGSAMGSTQTDSRPGAADSAHDPASKRDPANTRVNERDRHGTLTPTDQGGADAERKITAAIRREVVGDKSLSFTAKNVKIITNGGKVTLRGPVKTDEEKAAIEAHARQVEGVTEVDDQIEVKK